MAWEWNYRGMVQKRPRLNADHGAWQGFKLPEGRGVVKGETRAVHGG